MIPGLRRSPGEGKFYPLQYSGLENSMDCIVYGVAKSRTPLSDFHFSGFTDAFYLSSFPLVICHPLVSLKCSYFVILVAKLCLNLWLLLVACQTPMSMRFPRQEYWSGLPFLLQRIFLTQDVNPYLLCLLHWQVSSLH